MQSARFEDIQAGLTNQLSTNTPTKSNNPLVQAAIPLFAIASQMKYYYSNLSSSEVLRHLKQQVEQFEERAETSGVRYETVRAARYCLCTLLDEFAAKHGWADQAWMSNSLLVTFHSETWGGEHFFELLDKIKSEPEKNLNLIELMYYCLIIGYMGKYQVLNNGQVSIHNLKKELEKLLDKHKTLDTLPLLADKSQASKLTGGGRRVVPLWAVFGVLLSGLFGMYQWLSYHLDNKSEMTVAGILSLAPTNQAESVEPKTSTQRLTPLLKNEIQGGLIEVSETPSASKITILGDELFASGSDKIEDRFFPVLASVSQALNIVQGQIIVSGYTDDRPISSSVYPSNWHLSQGRADAVKAILLRYIQDGDRVRSEGKGDENPVAPNDSPMNRAKNRRVEIVVYLEQGSPSLQSTDGTQIQSVE